MSADYVLKESHPLPDPGNLTMTIGIDTLEQVLGSEESKDGRLVSSESRVFVQLMDCDRHVLKCVMVPDHAMQMAADIMKYANAARKQSSQK